MLIYMDCILFLVLSNSGGFFSFGCCYDNGMDFRGEV